MQESLRLERLLLAIYVLRCYVGREGRLPLVTVLQELLLVVQELLNHHHKKQLNTG